MNSNNNYAGSRVGSDRSDGDATLLNSLIATLLDSVEGYEKSAEDLENQAFRTMFLERARERQIVAAKLQEAVAKLGGTPEDDSSVMGSIHRVFVDLKAVVMGHDDKAIVNEVERGEDYLKGKFETAMKSADLSTTARDAVNEAWISVREGHDKMSALKHAMRG